MPFQLSFFNFTTQDYQDFIKKASDNSENFWASQAQMRLDWDTPFTQISSINTHQHPIKIEWFADGKMNACYNAIDRHCLSNPDKTALIWESDCGTQSQKLTYQDLKNEVEVFSAVLRSLGITSDDCVVIYMPMIPQAVIAMLACSRIGATHCVVFGGFSATALEERIKNSNAKLVITADQGKRGGKSIPLKENVDKALENCPNVHHCLVIEHTADHTVSSSSRDIRYNEIKQTVDAEKDGYYTPVSAEHPLFILYTSGSTGKPKGLVHTTGGYCVYSSFTHELSFNQKPDDIFFCTADIGWITGHSYLVYGPLLNGSTIVLFEGVPTYPTPSRLWEICDKHNVTTLYTAPTALRTLMSFGNEPVQNHNLSSLRVLGTVGEPINPEVFDWYHSIIGQGRCPVVDTWWQTETGGHIITAPAFLDNAPAGYAGKPYPTLDVTIVDDTGTMITTPHTQGYLVIKNSWPGQARSIHQDHARFFETYFSQFKGYYTTGDGAYYDEQGDIRITGRMDDVLNVSGHRLGTAELESALVAHDAVSEAAIVGFEHPIKGEAIYAFVTLMQGIQMSDALLVALRNKIRHDIGAIATPDVIQITSDLPKTRSGKIMRRILKKIANHHYSDFGDISTLSNPDSIDKIVQEAIRLKGNKS